MIEIVSITFRRGKKGERVNFSSINDFQISEPHPDDWPEDQPFFDYQNNPIDPAHACEERLFGVWADLPSDWFGMRFEFFGQFFDGQQSGLSYEVENVGAIDTFEDYIKRLRAIGDSLLDGEAERTKKSFDPVTPSEVTFLTAWDFRCGRDYDGEGWAEWDLLGLIDFSRIKELVVKEVKANG